ncbi:MFS transporter [Goodfellowiella coeruleoviolacea]|uniref:Arabinose efflux permease, MFS family n=1 Tax=Goodfellowiella coeruleoviolacea TaxID=334858 RepID=A0AAE3GMU8_9PSEU|nr:MFS transporter [Goodfellowiella coeruleoviolacea]MCP2170309.1 putative arabinose efflux permease, MFS family [Goodfellowiella coeruleoviolacea]
MSASSTPVDTGGGSAADAGGVFSARYRALTLGVVLSVSLVAFESLGVATVLPDIARDLGGLDSYGWGLAALMLANIIGTVVAGRGADRVGPATALGVALVVFAVGCVLAGVAGSWWFLLCGRAVQGLGVGAVMGLAYGVIGRAYPAGLQARAMALLSSAWTLPSLLGPPIAGLITEHASWRWVFVLLIPLVAAAALLTLPALARLAGTAPAARPAPDRPWWRGPVAHSVLLTLGTAVLLAAFELDALPAVVVLALVGGVLATVALRRVTPAGTLLVRPGVPAGIVVRALLCAVYFGSEAFLPLGLTELRGLDATLAGFGLSAGAITWVLGSALQARRDGRTGGGGRVTDTATGLAVLLLGVVIMAGAVLTSTVPALVAVAGWAVAGVGMGLAYNASSTQVLNHAPADQQGAVGAALQLAQTLATALLSGLGGGVIAQVHLAGGTTHTALTAIFVLTGLLALLGLPVVARLRAVPRG